MPERLILFFFGHEGGLTMPDKVGLLITTTPGDWQDYIVSFTDVWVRILGHPNNSVKKLPSGGRMAILKKSFKRRAIFRPTPMSRSSLRQAPERR